MSRERDNLRHDELRDEISDILAWCDWCDECEHPRCIDRYRSVTGQIQALINDKVVEELEKLKTGGRVKGIMWIDKRITELKEKL